MKITWVSNYRCPIWKSSNRTPVIGHPRDRAPITWQIGTRRTNHDREFYYRYDYNNNNDDNDNDNNNNDKSNNNIFPYLYHKLYYFLSYKLFTLNYLIKGLQQFTTFMNQGRKNMKVVQKWPIPPMRSSCRESWQFKKILSNLSANELKVAKLQKRAARNCLPGLPASFSTTPIAYLIDNLMTGFVNCIKRVIQGRLWHSSRTEKIGDHGYNNFVSPNHENKQLKYSFHDLFLH